MFNILKQDLSIRYIIKLVVERSRDFNLYNMYRKVKSSFALIVYSLIILVEFTMAQQNTQKPRCRDVGISPGILQPGKLNAISDVVDVTHKAGISLKVVKSVPMGVVKG